jgi:hypothetical protein
MSLLQSAFLLAEAISCLFRGLLLRAKLALLAATSDVNALIKSKSSLVFSGNVCNNNG